jgi:acetyl-CoA acetyltransferase
MNARVIADPICMLDCDIPIDGAAAFVLGRADRAKDHPNKPVYLVGYSVGNLPRPGTMWRVDDAQAAGGVTGKRLWENTGLKPSDIDLPQIYDGFSMLAWLWMEVLGFCPRGEAHNFVRDQKDLTKFFSGGGSIGNGRMHGIPPLIECYLQLSGRAGARQMDVHTGLACHSHPHFGGVVAFADQRL